MLKLAAALSIAFVFLTQQPPPSDPCAAESARYDAIVSRGRQSPMPEFYEARDALMACMGVIPVFPPTPTPAME